MPFFESPALYIDFSRLPPPQVVEEIDYEALLKVYQNYVVGKLPTLKKAISLEQSPTNVILESEVYGEMIVRARINAAARAVMLPFAIGSDLDNLAAFYEEVRDPLVENPRPFLTNPEDWESDERFRRKVQLSPEAFSTAGSEGAYVYHALKSDVTIRDASAIRLDRSGSVKVTIMSQGADPVPNAAQIDAAIERLHRRNIKPLTAVITVAPPRVKRTEIRGEITLYPGPDQALVRSDIVTGLSKIRDRLSKLGRDLNRSAIIGAIDVEGVHNVNLPVPAENIPAANDECVLITDVILPILTSRQE